MAAAQDAITVDLVLATVGRSAELVPFLDSLVAQTHRSVRVIVVDQNADDRALKVIDRYRNRLSVLHLTAPRGLSRARNAGLRHVEADVIGFPDDDCAYPPQLLARIVEMLVLHPHWGGVAGRTIARDGRSTFLRWAAEPGLVSRAAVWRTAVATSIFLRRTAVAAVGDFDEEIGAGAGTVWGSGEETDYVLRALDAGVTLAYQPSLAVFHESPSPPVGRAALRKGYTTGMGNSLILRRHGYSWSVALTRALQAVAASALFVARGQPGRGSFYGAMAVGRIRGWSTARRERA